MDDGEIGMGVGIFEKLAQAWNWRQQCDGSWWERKVFQ
jgi:hypothetical protein